MAAVSGGHSSLEMICGRLVCPQCRARCGVFASNLRRLLKITKCSNVRVASVRTMSFFLKDRHWFSVAEMSALGQKWTLERFWAMSALPPKADVKPQFATCRT
jgi:hypothetical protein